MFHKINDTMYCQSRNKNINLNLKYKISDKDKKSKIDKDLIRLTDKIFYANGIFDKLYYDDSLINANIYNPIFIRKLSKLIIMKNKKKANKNTNQNVSISVFTLHRV